MQQKGWSIFFGAVLLASFLLCAVAPLVGWGLPANVSSYGREVDYLYYVILAFTTFFFVSDRSHAGLRHVSLRLAAQSQIRLRRGQSSPGNAVDHRAGRHFAVHRHRSDQRLGEDQVSGQDAGAGPGPANDGPAMGLDHALRRPMSRAADADARGWAEIPEIDDIYLPDELHCWQGANVSIYLKTQDVLAQSVSCRNLRLKQDALPGKTIPMWFNATDFNTTIRREDRQVRADRQEQGMGDRLRRTVRRRSLPHARACCTSTKDKKDYDEVARARPSGGAEPRTGKESPPSADQ